MTALLAAQGVPVSLAELAADLLKLSAAGYTAKGVADALLFLDDAKASDYLGRWMTQP